MRPVLDNSLVGCVSEAGYNYVVKSNITRSPLLRGRPRYRLKDANTTYTVDVTIHMSSDRLTAWQSFWNGPLKDGSEPFIMRLALGSSNSFQTGEEYLVHAVGSWNASLDVFGDWAVNLKVEVPPYISTTITYCDVIWAGEIVILPADDVYGGPISSLATDVIEPCDRVLNG